MPLTAKPLSTAYRNLGEKNYRLGVEIVDTDGDAVDITGSVTLIYTDPNGSTFEETGTSVENEAYYQVTALDFQVSGTYKYWIKCFDVDIYGPFELKIMDVPEISS